MAKYITINKAKYLIRGPWTATDLHRLYAAFCVKYPDTKLSFAEWANRGHIYLKVSRK